jgi:hypothetical protein
MSVLFLFAFVGTAIGIDYHSLIELEVAVSG